MRCDQLQELVQTAVTGVSSPIELGGRLPLEAHRHLQKCAACRRLTHELASLEARLRGLTEVPPPPEDAVARVMAAVRQRGREHPVVRRESFPWQVVAALAALVLGLGVQYLWSQPWLPVLAGPVQAWSSWFWSALASVPTVVAVPRALPSLPSLSPSPLTFGALVATIGGIAFLNWRWTGASHG